MRSVKLFLFVVLMLSSVALSATGDKSIPSGLRIDSNSQLISVPRVSTVAIMAGDQFLPNGMLVDSNKQLVATLRDSSGNALPPQGGACGVAAVAMGSVCTIVGVPSNNCTPGALALRSNGAVDTTLYVCTSTNTWTAATISGTSANATNIGITDDTSTNATMYPVWVTANSGFNPAKVSSTKITFNPSTATLTTTTFSGALSGNATTATSATTATTSTNSTNLTTTDDTTTNATYYPGFQTAISGTNPFKTSSTKWTYNPSTGIMVIPAVDVTLGQGTGGFRFTSGLGANIQTFGTGNVVGFTFDASNGTALTGDIMDLAIKEVTKFQVLATGAIKAASWSPSDYLCTDASSVAVTNGAVCVASYLAIKHGVQPLSTEFSKSILGRTGLYTYCYNPGKRPGKDWKRPCVKGEILRGGIIADWSDPFLTYDGKHFDEQNALAITMQVVKSQQKEIDDLKRRIARLESFFATPQPTAHR